MRFIEVGFRIVIGAVLFVIGIPFVILHHYSGKILEAIEEVLDI